MTWFTDSRPWQSGPWSLVLRDDELADIAFHGRAVLRSVRAVVRDRDWDTAELVVDRVRESGTTLTLHVRGDDLGASFRGVVRIEARGDRLIVLTDLESAAEFSTNRTGLVVLHPPHLAGAALRVTHTDGSLDQLAFPREISPHQPVRDIAQLAWTDRGAEVSVDFDGDVFEMEDQRNWSDASYKTYSRPLDLPFPYPIVAGERVRQSVSIRVREMHAPASAIDTDVVRLRVGGPVVEIALGAATAPEPSPARASETPAAVLVELDLRTPNWPQALERAASAGAPLDVRVVARAGASLDTVVGALERVTPSVVRIGVFDADRHVTTAHVLDALRAARDAAGLDVPIVGGSRAHFTQLNREWHELPSGLDAIAFATTPLFHSLGTEQLVESIGVQRTIAVQAVAMAGSRPVHVGPVTLRPRYNDVATAAQPLPRHLDASAGYGAEFAGADDPRQTAPELAAWTIASAAALAVPGVASIAYFEEWGARGIRSREGTPFPVAAAISRLIGLRTPEARMLWGDSPDGRVWALGARSSGADVVLVANLDRAPRRIALTVDGTQTPIEVAASAWRRIDLTR